MNIKKIWDDAKKLVSGKVSSVSYDLWVKPLVAEAFENGAFILAAPTTSGKKQAENPRHFEHIESAVKETAPIVETVQIIDAIERDERRASSANNNGENAPKSTEKTKKRAFNVNPMQTFDNFVVGKSNQIVYTAAETVAKNLGKSINPLFIYGGVGLGKTHLLNAIVNYILHNSPKTVIAFASSENFTNDFVETLKNGKTNPTALFREKYRTADVLLIDDIQFIRDKKGIQEEFFHTFNDLIQNGRQVVLTSDRHPDEMSTLEERMRSRFKMGLIQDITTPDKEMWLAILQKKASNENQKLAPEVLKFLSGYAYEKNINVREMEGILTKITLYARMNNKNEPDLDDCNAALRETADTAKYQTTAEKIIEAVGKYFNVTRDDITGKRRNREFVEPRMISIYLISEFLNIPLLNIGQLLGGRDHTTVMHARNKIEGQVQTDQRIKRIVGDIKKMIDGE